MSDDRIQLPELDRTEPVRDWSTMFKASRTNGHAPQTSAATDEDVSQKARANGHASERDVAMGYRVIDEYMRLGAAAARNLAQGGGLDPTSANQMFDRLLEAASDLGGVWIEMLQALWSTQAGPQPKTDDAGAFEFRDAPPRSSPPPAAGDPPPANQPGVTVAFRVQGGRDVEASAELSARPGDGAWLVHDLRARDTSIPRITDVAFDYDAGAARALIRIRIPPEQPAGVYSGLIVDDVTNLPRGTVCVRLS